MTYFVDVTTRTKLRHRDLDLVGVGQTVQGILGQPRIHQALVLLLLFESFLDGFVKLGPLTLRLGVNYQFIDYPD